MLAAILTTLVSALPLAAVQVQDTVARSLAADVRVAITPAALSRHAREIVRHERPSGSAGENAAIDYIVTTLQSAGVAVEVHTIDAYASDPISATVEVVGAAGESIDAITAAYSGAVRGLEAQVVDLGPIGDLPDLEAGTGENLVLQGEAGGAALEADRYAAVRGAIALVDGQPRNVPVTVLARLGAVGVIFANPEDRLNDLIVTSTWGVPSLRNAHRLETIPVAQVRKSGGERLRSRLAEGSLRVRLSTEVATGWKPLRLVVARIPGPEADSPYALLGGHIDAWYHGGTDEGASNAAMLELALVFQRERSRLRRGLVVAWWPGHSNARYSGSTWFADAYHDELRKRGLAYLNIDGVGQLGAKRFGATATSSLELLARDVVRERAGQEIRVSRPGRNSDQSFNGIGLPLLQLDHTRLAEDGGYWWWHTPDDTFDKIDFDVLLTDTHLYADALAALLASATVPVDVVGEVRALGDVMRRRQAQSGGRLDLAEAVLRQERLLAIVESIRSNVSAADVELVRILRPLHRVLYSPSDPYHPDAGVDGSLLPGLSPVTILASEDPASDRYRFALTTLVRERNRLLEALDTALEEAQRVEDRR